MMAPRTTRVLDGLRVLVVEDTVLVAELIVEQLGEHGCSVVGPAARLSDALRLAAREQFDGALLDVNLAGEHSFPVAALLAARGVPFIFLSGYGSLSLPAEFDAAPRLLKPFEMEELIQRVASSFPARMSAPLSFA